MATTAVTVVVVVASVIAIAAILLAVVVAAPVIVLVVVVMVAAGSVIAAAEDVKYKLFHAILTKHIFPCCIVTTKDLHHTLYIPLLCVADPPSYW